jgi:hypothetical protein
MRQALWILQKDIRHLWPRAAVFVCLAVLYANGDASAPGNPRLEGAGVVFSFALWLAAAFLAVSVVHEDRLVGDRKFWITRPYSWKSLLLAKGLFVLLFLHLPLLLAQIAELEWNGLSPLHYGPQLLWRQITFAAWTIFPCAALAAITRNLVQVVVTSLAALVVFVAAMFELEYNWLYGRAVVPVDTACHAALAMLFAGLACWYQFARRSAFLARCWFVCGLVASLTWFPVIPWSAAFAWLVWRSPAIDAAAVRLAPDAPRRVGGGWGFGVDGDKVLIFFPIQVAGIPEGTVVYSEGVKIALRSGSGKTWISSWSRAGDITDHTLLAVSKHPFLPGAGAPYWLVAHVDKRFFDAFSTEPVHVRATVAFTLLDRARTTQFNAWEKVQPIADHGFCYPVTQGNSVATASAEANTDMPVDRSRTIPTSPITFASVSCVTPFREAAFSFLRIEPSATVEMVDSVSGFSGHAFDVGGTVFSIWENIRLGGQAPAGPFVASIETRQAVAHFERTLEMPGVVLAELRGK